MFEYPEMIKVLVAKYGKYDTLKFLLGNGVSCGRCIVMGFSLEDIQNVYYDIHKKSAEL